MSVVRGVVAVDGCCGGAGGGGGRLHGVVFFGEVKGCSGDVELMAVCEVTRTNFERVLLLIHVDFAHSGRSCF